MVCLQEEKFRERQRVKEVQLQYYQLQVNPHFFELSQHGKLAAGSAFHRCRE